MSLVYSFERITLSIFTESGIMLSTVPVDKFYGWYLLLILEKLGVIFVVELFF